MKRVLILVNPYLSEPYEWHHAERLKEEFARLGVQADVENDLYLAGTERDTLALTAPIEEFAFCVYLDKDKYCPRILEKAGLKLYNSAQSIELCDDKMLTHIALSGIVPMPRTLPAPLCYKSGADFTGEEEKIIELLKLPVVVKQCYGSLGEQVFLAKTKEELISLRRKLRFQPHLYQEFIKESAGRDIRALTVGGKVVAAMERRSETDFRSNVRLGGKGTACEVTDEMRDICGKASAALGLDYCGIDLLESEEGLLVCEVNSNAFFGGLERATGVNVAAAYAKYLCEKNALL